MNCIDITIMLKIIKLFKLVLKFRIFNEYLEIEKNDGINIWKLRWYFQNSKKIENVNNLYIIIYKDPKIIECYLQVQFILLSTFVEKMAWLKICFYRINSLSRRMNVT